MPRKFVIPRGNGASVLITDSTSDKIGDWDDGWCGSMAFLVKWSWCCPEEEEEMAESEEVEQDEGK